MDLARRTWHVGAQAMSDDWMSEFEGEGEGASTGAQGGKRGRDIWVLTERITEKSGQWARWVSMGITHCSAGLRMNSIMSHGRGEDVDCIGEREQSQGQQEGPCLILVLCLTSVGVCIPEVGHPCPLLFLLTGQAHKPPFQWRDKLLGSGLFIRFVWEGQLSHTWGICSPWEVGVSLVPWEAKLECFWSLLAYGSEDLEWAPRAIVRKCWCMHVS